MMQTGEGDNDNVGDEPDIPMEDNPSIDKGTGKKESKEESAESASTGSSEGKSGSGGGYSADCSASDQSSDENGDRKESNPDLNLKVGSLSMHDRAASRSSNSSDEVEQSQENDQKDDMPEDGDCDEKSGSKPSDHGESSSLAIDLPLKSPDLIDLESIVRSKTEEERENANALQDQSVLPQWNGVRVAHPMDPRIDLSSVTVLQAGIASGAFHPIAQQQIDNAQASGENAAPFSVETYSQLMEVIRPFFQSHGVAWQRIHSQVDNFQKNESGSEQLDSSEGFTSFFTTTNSGNNSGGTTNSSSPQSSDLDKKPRALNNAKMESDNADASSMVVLARVKRKHKKAEDSGNSASSGDKRVRIQERRDDKLSQQENKAEYEPDTNGESSGSSSLTNAGNQGQHEQQPQQPQAPLHISVSPRIVTDVSSKTSSATNSIPNTSTGTSGSGSGGNTGSGSNQGSSGSGNEGKGSSEEPAQGDNSGDSPVDGSDQSYKKDVQFNVLGPETEAKHDTDRETRLLDKKRKRIEMRREYEAQQQIESSESSDPSVSIVRPGKAVTMDQVLRFSKIPRIVLQATPPFLIVHTNAAFARLTGIDSHQAVGQPISSLVFLPENTGFQEEQPEDGLNAQGSDLSSTGRIQEGQAKAFKLERLIATCGHGKLQILKVVSRAHQMVGRSVTITKEVSASESKEGSAGSNSEAATKNDLASLSSRKGTYQKTCRASIAPIVSVSAYFPKTSMSFEKEADPLQPKRRKSHCQEGESPSTSTSQAKDHKSRPSSPGRDHKKHPSRLVVTHYLIQVEDAILKTAKDFSAESLSSNATSVEARLLGLSKEDFQKQKLATLSSQDDRQDPQGPAEDEGVRSESTAAPEHVSALG